MSRSRNAAALQRSGLLSACVIGWACAGPVFGDVSNGLAGCRKITDDGQRLACYDALAPAAADAVVAKPTVVPSATAPVPPAAIVAAPAIPASSPVVAAPPQQSFGAETIEKKADTAPEILTARVVGSFDGVTRGTRFRLDNGQIWTSIDDHGYDYEGENPSVTIQHNSFGSYWMRLEHSHFNLRVSRVE